MGAHETKTFISGNSVALRLPKGLAIGPNEKMIIERSGDGFTLRRVNDPAAARAALVALVADLQAIGIPNDIQDREPFEFPDRPGL